MLEELFMLMVTTWRLCTPLWQTESDIRQFVCIVKSAFTKFSVYNCILRLCICQWHKIATHFQTCSNWSKLSNILLHDTSCMLSPSCYRKHVTLINTTVYIHPYSSVLLACMSIKTIWRWTYKTQFCMFKFLFTISISRLCLTNWWQLPHFAKLGQPVNQNISASSSMSRLSSVDSLPFSCVCMSSKKRLLELWNASLINNWNWKYQSNITLNVKVVQYTHNSQKTRDGSSWRSSSEAGSWTPEAWGRTQTIGNGENEAGRRIQETPRWPTQVRRSKLSQIKTTLYSRKSYLVNRAPVKLSNCCILLDACLARGCQRWKKNASFLFSNITCCSDILIAIWMTAELYTHDTTSGHSGMILGLILCLNAPKYIKVLVRDPSTL